MSYELFLLCILPVAINAADEKKPLEIVTAVTSTTSPHLFLDPTNSGTSNSTSSSYSNTPPFFDTANQGYLDRIQIYDQCGLPGLFTLDVLVENEGVI